MRGPERDEALDPLGVLEARDEADPAGPVVADQLDLVEAERVEQSDQVALEALLVEAAGRRVAPAVAAHVGSDYAVARLGERPDDLAPAPPVLRPSVQQHERLSLPRFGHVQAHAAHLVERVRDPFELRHRRRHVPRVRQSDRRRPRSRRV